MPLATEWAHGSCCPHCHLRSGNGADLASALHHGCVHGNCCGAMGGELQRARRSPDRSTYCWRQIRLRIFNDQSSETCLSASSIIRNAAIFAQSPFSNDSSLLSAVRGTIAEAST